MPAAIVYAHDLARLQAFYERVAKLEVHEVTDDYVVMEELVLVSFGDGYEPESPVVRREDAAVKLVFDVPVLAAARVRAAQLGGVLDPVDSEWEFGEFRVCDGHDVEGNPIQLRQPRE